MKLTVILSTYNREDDLKGTLESMTKVDFSGLDVELVVVDNNSSDATKEVVASHESKLPLVYLFESRPGKNAALNHALRSVVLGDIVVFTDDDVDPHEDWLHEIRRKSLEHPNVSVFGGRIDIKLPKTHIPNWAKEKSFQDWALARHDWTENEEFYPKDRHPCGPNFWVKRGVFDDGRLYDESIGPRPGKKRKMGSEASFLLQLSKDGYDILYCPSAIVKHRSQPELFTEKVISKRAYQYGRGLPHLRGIKDPEGLKRSRSKWMLMRRVAIAKHYAKYFISYLHPNFSSGYAKRLQSIRWIGFNIESMEMAREGDLD